MSRIARVDFLKGRATSTRRSRTTRVRQRYVSRHPTRLRPITNNNSAWCHVRYVPITDKMRRNKRKPIRSPPWRSAAKPSRSAAVKHNLAADPSYLERNPSSWLWLKRWAHGTQIYPQATISNRKPKAEVAVLALADIKDRLHHVCFAPESGHKSDITGCPLSAKSGHSPSPGDEHFSAGFLCEARVTSSSAASRAV